MKGIERSSLPDPQEMVRATMAVTLGCAPLEYPRFVGTAVHSMKWSSPADLQQYLANPDVFLIHPVTMLLDAPEQRLMLC